MIYTYRNFISTLLQMNTSWYIHTETLDQFSCSCTRDDIYIPQLYINFPADEHLMIYTYRNFILISSRWTRDDVYIPRLYSNFPAVDHLLIYMYRNFISIFQQINALLYIHRATLYQLSCRWTPDDIYIP